jgi:hypothetical protein
MAAMLTGNLLSEVEGLAAGSAWKAADLREGATLYSLPGLV